ncbi:GAF domain-containing protein [Chloroflexota bacterium]
MNDNHKSFPVRVLIADDEPLVRMGLEDFLSSEHGFDVETVSSGEQALEAVRQAKPGYYAVVVLDHYFEEGPDGLDVLPTIKDLQPELPVIMLTGKAFEIGVQALLLGAYSYLTKPIANEELAAMIHGLLQQDTTLRQLAATVREVLKAPLCVMWVLDQKRERFQIRAWDGPLDEEYRQKAVLDYYDAATQEFLTEGVSLSLENVRDPSKAKDYRHPEQAEKHGWRSLLSAPMISRGRVIGILDVYSIGAVRQFNEQDRRLSQAFSSQAAAVVYNDHLYRRSQALSEINRLLSGTYDLGAVLDLILAEVLELVGTDIGWLYLLDREEDELRISTHRGLDEAGVQDRRKLGKGVTGWVAQHGEAQLVSDVTVDKRYIPAKRRDIRSEIVVPLKREGVTLGVLAAKSIYPNAFAEEDLAVLSNFAIQAALAVERDKLARHAREVSRLALSGRAEELADYVASAVHDLTGLTAVLWLMDENEQILRVEAHRGLQEGYAQTATTPLEGSITGTALTEGRPKWRRDIQNDREQPPFHNLREAELQNWHFFICVPLLGQRGQPLGSLSLYGPRPQDCSESLQTLLWTFANQVAIALENAELLDQAEDRQKSLEHLVDVGETVTQQTVAGLRTVLERIGESACDLFAADFAAIYPYDPEQELFYDVNNAVVYVKGRGVERDLGLKSKPRIGGLADIIRKLGELVVEDTSEDNLRIEKLTDAHTKGVEPADVVERVKKAHFIQRMGVRAFVGLSLRAGQASDEQEEKEVGVLYLDFRNPTLFTEEQLDLMRIFGHQVGSAIQNARLLENSQRQTEGHRKLNLVGADLLGIHNESDILGKVADSTVDALPCDHCSVLLLEGEELVIHAVKGTWEKDLDEGRSFDLGEGVAGWVAQHGEPLLVPDTVKDSRFAPGWSEQGDPKSLVVVPIFLEGEVYGVISAEQAQEAAFSQYHVRLLRTLATQTSQAVQNARLYRRLQRQIRRLEILSRVGQTLSGKLEPQAIYKAVVDAVVETLECTHCTFFAAEGERLVPKEFYLRDSEIKITRTFAIGEGLAGQVAKTGEAILTGDAKRGEHFLKGETHPDAERSLVVVPVKAADLVIGVVSVDEDKLGAFDEQDQAVVQTIAHQAGTALRNASLFDTERRRADEMTLLQQVSARISTTTDLDESLRFIVQGALELMKMNVEDDDSGVIHAIDEAAQRISHSYEFPVGSGHLRSRFSKGKGITREIFDEKQALVIPDVATSERVSSGLAQSKVQSLIGVPLKLGEKVVGALFLNSSNPRDFSAREQALLGTLAEQAAITIEKARLVRHLDARATQLLRLQEVSRVISSEPSNIDRSLKLISENINEIVENAFCVVRLYEAETDDLSLQVATGPLADHKYPPRPDGTSRYLIQHREPRYLEGEALVRPPDGGPGVRQEFLDLGIRAAAHLPLITEDDLVGILYVNLIGEGGASLDAGFTTSDRQVLELFAGQAANAIKNARRQRALADLNESTQVLLAVRDPDEVLDRIVDEAQNVLGTKLIVLYEYREGENDVGVPPRVGGDLQHPDVVEARGQVRPHEESAVFHVVQREEPYYAHDAQRDWAKLGIQGYDEEKQDNFVAREAIASSVGFPLISGGERVGILFANYRNPQTFPPERRDFMQLFAGAAALGIQQARLFGKQREWGERLARLQEITTAISAKSAQGENIPQLIVDNLTTIFRGNPCAIRLYSPDRTGFLPRIFAGPLDDLAGYEPRDEGTSWYVAQERKPRYLSGDELLNPPDKGPAVRPELLEKGVKAVATLPLISDGQVVGMLYLYLMDTAYLADSDKQILELFADQAAIAVENARLYEHISQNLERRIRELEVLTEIGRTVSNFGIDQILGLVYVEMDEIVELGDAQVQFAFYDETEDEVSFPLAVEQDDGVTIDVVRWSEREARYREPGEAEFVEQFVARARRDPPGLNEYVIRRKQPLLIEENFEQEADGRGIRVWPTFGRLDRPTESWLGVPMMVGGRVTGVISIQSLEQEHAFDEDHVQVLTAIANQAAVAIENARLYEHISQNLERRIRELEALTEIGRTVSNFGIDQILGLVYVEMDKIMDLSDAQVQFAFYDKTQDEVSFPYAVEQDDGTIIDVVRWSKREAPYREAGEGELVKQFRSRARRDPPGLNEYVIRGKQPLLIVENFEQEAAERGIQIWPTFGRLDRPTESWLGVPMMVGGRVTGVISIRSLKQEHAFDEDHVQVLTAIANQAATAVENARLYAELDRERLQLRSQLINAERLLVESRFAAGYVHRVNNLIGTIPFRVGQIRETLADSPDILQRLEPYLEGIFQDAVRVSPVTRELRELAEREPELEVLNVVSALKRVARRVRIQTPIEIRLKEDYPSDERLLVRATAWELSDAFWNIVRNGAEAMIPSGGTLSLKAALVEDRIGHPIAEIGIHNTGPKIPEERLGQIFEPFRSSKGSTGYGLWRTRHVIEQELGGTISIENDDNDQVCGVSTVIRLPIAIESESGTQLVGGGTS